MSESKDHREIGRELDLFSFHEVAPGAPFWHPKGMIIYKELEKFIREENEKMGYGEVSTPILVKKELWEKSGHWENFRDNMFHFQIGEETHGLKPMNCPESALIYSNTVRSYKDLPLRLAEPTGKLHRKEVSGSVRFENP
ncbi:MAG: threonyl-tRNA synthetase [Parcubacteria group bacterium Gr01-1014_2]|nr:MAG: threonyl-tRNA synthetase [Parcubacteria group bacterium Gr01-1014_2]